MGSITGFAKAAVADSQYRLYLLRMRALSALVLAAVLALPVATVAHAAEAPMTKAGLLTAINSNKVWCARWEDKTQSCEEVAFLEARQDAIRQTRRYRMYEAVDLEVIVRSAVEVQGGALCSTFKFEDLEVVVLMDGEPAPAEEAARSKIIVAQVLSDLEGKKTCEIFARDDKTGLLTSKVTLDGKAAPEFDTDYRLLSPDTRIQLRPVFEETEASSIT